MQLIGESYDLLRRVGGHDVDAIADVFAAWNEGDLESYLIEITAEVLRQRDAETGEPLVDVILDQAGSKGTGVWTVQNAVGLGIPVGGIARGRLRARRVEQARAARGGARAVESRPEPATGRRRLRGRRARRPLRVQGRRLRAGLRRDHRRRPGVRLGHRPRGDRARSGAAAASSAPGS